MAEYTQNASNCPHKSIVSKGKTFYTPPNSSTTGCWICKNGCAVLCVLKKKGLAVTADNIEKYLNSNNDVAWSSAGLSSTSMLATGVIAKQSGKQHYVLITGGSKDKWTIHDPGCAANRAAGVVKPDSFFDTSKMYA